MRALSSQEREIIIRRFGLRDERPHTLKEIGLDLRLSRERVRQIETAALEKLRRAA